MMMVALNVESKFGMIFPNPSQSDHSWIDNYHDSYPVDEIFLEFRQCRPWKLFARHITYRIRIRPYRHVHSDRHP